MDSQLRRLLLAENPWLRGEDLLSWIRRFLPASFACEVKAGDSRGILSRSARSFLEAYQPEQFLIVSRSSRPSIQEDATLVRYLPVEELASTVEAFLGTDRVPLAGT